MATCPFTKNLTAWLIEYGNRVPLEIRHQFQDLLRDSFLVPSLRHYLR